MLVDFQQALADLTASPYVSRLVRKNPELLLEHYHLSKQEFERLTGIVQHPGMSCACTVYRANRLAPLALNVPGTCKALGTQLRTVADEFWAKYQEGDVHFFVEADRFCVFVREKLSAGAIANGRVRAIVEREHAAIKLALLESQFES